MEAIKADVNELMEKMDITSQRENTCLCRPVIINISKTYWGISAKKRPSASRDQELLLKTFEELGFADPYIISDTNSHLETDPLYSVENLIQELQKIGIHTAYHSMCRKFSKDLIFTFLICKDYSSLTFHMVN